MTYEGQVSRVLNQANALKHIARQLFDGGTDAWQPDDNGWYHHTGYTPLNPELIVSVSDEGLIKQIKAVFVELGFSFMPKIERKNESNQITMDIAISCKNIDELHARLNNPEKLNRDIIAIGRSAVRSVC